MWWALLMTALAFDPVPGEVVPSVDPDPGAAADPAPAEGEPPAEAPPAEGEPAEAAAPDPTDGEAAPDPDAIAPDAIEPDSDDGEPAPDAIEPEGHSTSEAIRRALEEEPRPTRPPPAPVPVVEPVAEPPDPAEELYNQALEAWEWGHWSKAYELATRAVELDPDDEAARLLQGFALSRTGQWSDGLDLVRPLVHSPSVGAHARFWVRRHDRRWTRQDWAISLGMLLRPDRGNFPVWHSGLGLSVDAPLAEMVTLRTDLTTPIHHRDTMQLYGVPVAVMPVFHTYARSWSFHAGLGPNLFIGESQYWSGAFRGVFPGFRATLGADSRVSRRTGLRLQADYDVLFGARRFLREVSHGITLRGGYVVFL